MFLMTGTVSDCDLIRKFLKLVFQMIVTGVIRIRHGGSEDTKYRCCVMSIFKMESADIPRPVLWLCAMQLLCKFPWPPPH